MVHRIGHAGPDGGLPQQCRAFGSVQSMAAPPHAGLRGSLQSSTTSVRLMWCSRSPETGQAPPKSTHVWEVCFAGNCVEEAVAGAVVLGEYQIAAAVLALNLHRAVERLYEIAQHLVRHCAVSVAEDA